MVTLQMPHHIAESGDYGRDNWAGGELAKAWIAGARAEGSHVALTMALRSLAESGRWGGVEVGFATALAFAVIQ